MKWIFVSKVKLKEKKNTSTNSIETQKQEMALRVLVPASVRTFKVIVILKWRKEKVRTLL